MTFISTFHTHFGAMNFLRRLKAKGDQAAEMMPVPRELSASCGVCVRFTAGALDPMHRETADLDGIYQVTDAGYQLTYTAE